MAARETELELMRQLAAAVALVEFIGQLYRIDEPRRADRTALAGCDRAHARAADSHLHAAVQQCLLDRLDVCQLNERNLDALPRGQMHIALAILLRDLLDRTQLRGSEVPADRFQPHREIILLFLAHEAALLEFFIIHSHGHCLLKSTNPQTNPARLSYLMSSSVSFVTVLSFAT